MNDSFPENFVELVFEFDEIKVFHGVHLYANNYFTRDVQVGESEFIENFFFPTSPRVTTSRKIIHKPLQVFAKAKVWFSVGGQFYNGKPLSYSYMPDTVLENARNVTIGLHGRSGRFVKLHLYFANRWIMISEVTFETCEFFLCLNKPDARPTYIPSPSRERAKFQFDIRLRL